MKYIIFFTLILFTYLSAYDKTYDDDNVYYESEHFRVIAGIDYNTSVTIQNKAYIYLDAAETSWNKEVIELGFNEPYNTDIKKIDIYIGNKNAIAMDNVDTSIPSNFAGYATSYPSDNSPYFVMNPTITEQQIKVTIAHEFFHTIQYSYYDFLKISDDDKFTSLIWWLEATATLMEDEVFDDIDDYVLYLNKFFDQSYKSIYCYDSYDDFFYNNNLREYSMVIFAKFIKEKYGMQTIVDSFSNFKEDGDFYNIFDDLLQKNHNTNMQEALGEFAVWVSNASKYFEEGSNYPTLKRYDSNSTVVLEKGGIQAVNNLKKGWNMVSLPNLSLETLYIPNMEYIWSYKNGIWKVNILNNKYEQISSSDISKGYWVKVTDDSYIPYTYFDKDANNILLLESGWNLLGTSSKLSVNVFMNEFVWQYNSIEQKWYLYTTDSQLMHDAIELGYGTLEEILPYSSYWVYKN